MRLEKIGGMPMNFAPLYVKTEYSLLESMIRIEEYVSYAKTLGYQMLGISDTTMSGAYEFYKACRKEGIKPLLGFEVQLKGFPLLLYAKDEIGYRNLNQLSTIQSKDSLTELELTQFSASLICLLPVTSQGLYPSVNKIYPEIYFGYRTEQERELIKDHRKIPLVPISALKKHELECLSYLEAIKRGVLLEEVEQPSSTYLMTEEEWQKYLPSAFVDGKEFYEELKVTIDYIPDLLPIYETPGKIPQYEYLKHLCKEGLKRRFGLTVSKVYIERLKYELEVIHKMGFCNYFLVVWDYVKYAKEHGILVGPGRGSAAGSLVSYCLRITDVDPLYYNLLFERFLNPERITMPDIDIDFEYLRREEVIQYCIQKYGLKKVAGIITFGTLGAKQVIRDVGRVMNLPLKQIDFTCKLLDSKLDLRENYKVGAKLRDFIQGEESLRKLYQVATKLEGLKRHTSIHAAGIVMSNQELDQIIPLVYHDTMYLTGYSMNYLEELGLLKMDFLALKTLTTIQNILEEVQKQKAISFDQIPMNDPSAIQIFYDVNTIGIFQFESRGMMNFLRKFKPNSFEDIVAALALYRPGPMGNIDLYIRRRNGKETVDYLHPDLEPILKPTYGVLIYQEQIMQVANVMAGYSLGEADVLRRAMSKKKEEILLKERDKFITRSLERGYTESLSQKVYDLILKFADYGFNRSHSVAYALIAYKMAYLKAYYPAYFMKSLLTEAIGKSVDTKDYIYECKLNHICIVAPDINYSKEQFLVEQEQIRFPLTGIKNLGMNSVRSILEERQQGLFQDIYDFVRRTYGKSVNKKTLESLIDAGCFDSFHLTKRTLHENLDLIVNYGDLVKDLGEEYALKPELEIYPEYSQKECMKRELEVFGFYLSNHPVTEYRLKQRTVPLDQIEFFFDKTIDLIVIIDDMKEIMTKNSEKMCFITGSDEVATIDIVLFPKIYQQYFDLEVGMILKVMGKVEKRFDKYQIVVRSLELLGQ